MPRYRIDYLKESQRPRRVAAALLLVLVGLAAWFWPQLDWRTQLVRRKFQGELSLVSWSEVARCLYPQR